MGDAPGYLQSLRHPKSQDSGAGTGDQRVRRGHGGQPKRVRFSVGLHIGLRLGAPGKDIIRADTERHHTNFAKDAPLSVRRRDEGCLEHH